MAQQANQITSLPLTIWSDLAPIKTLSEPIIQFLVTQVASQITNRNKTKGAISVFSISKELENESIEWSNKKILQVTNALKSLLIAYFSGYSPEETEAKQTLKDEILSRSSIQKDAVVEALANAVDAEASEASRQESIASVMKLQQLIDFQVVLKHEFSTQECKKVDHTRAVLLFKIQQPDGSVHDKRLDVSLDELRQFKKEMVRVEETLS